MKELLTVSVCIPAYNEQNNIGHILKQLLSQKQDGFVIERIIVASDGSTDKTVTIASKFIPSGIEIIDGKENRGQTYRQNDMISKVSSDILVLINADLLLKSDDVILKLTAPICKGADLSAQWAKPITPHTFLEHILYAGFILKNFVYTRYKNGDNVYTCVGHIRALSKRFYSNITFPAVSYGEDQYLYFACISGGYKYKYVNADNVLFKLPETFFDYIKYAKRIFQTQKKFGDVFDEKIVRSERSIPFSLKLRAFIYTFIKNPLYTTLYIILHTIVQQWALKQPVHTNHVFETSASTKRLVTNN